MFEPSAGPRVFGLPPGVDFPQALIEGLHARLAGQPPEAMARVQVIVNTRRMARRLRDLFDAGPPALLPRISLVTDLAEIWQMDEVPPAVPPLRRRFELTRLIAALLEKQPDLAPRSALFDLADSLARLMDEMQGEGVDPDAIEALDVTDQSGHWARIKAFLGIISVYFDASHDAPDTEARQRMVVAALTRHWMDMPPAHPIIIAGSTGSRGTTQRLMRAVAALPQGALVLPGFDHAMPGHVWHSMESALHAEDHPQYRFHALLENLGMQAEDVRPWARATPPNPARNRLISLALRPAPVTDQWLRDGPALGDLRPALEDVTLLEAPSGRAEALAIALRLRAAAEEGETAALITPDRSLARQVTAALDRWGILPDDSAGQPLHLAPPGRFLRHVATLWAEPLNAGNLLTLLKHPLTHSGGARNVHLRLTRELELHLRRHGPPYPAHEDFRGWAETRKEPLARAWAEWLGSCFCWPRDGGEHALASRVNDHLDLAARIAAGCKPEGESRLWQETAGRTAHDVCTSLRDEAVHGGPSGARDYASLFHAVLSRHEVRNPDTPHPRILIWGTLEARVQGAGLVILAGLNEGTWPAAPDPDPWLNRALRHQAGLLLPERRIGLSAHDFQQAAAAREVWFSRAIRSDDAQTVASRWLNRLTNLLGGLPAQGGDTALAACRDRGAAWLGRARALEKPTPFAPAPRPAPRPPVGARPTRLSVTEIKRLIRDPYAIYVKHVLGLRPLDPLMRVPDALLRGIVLHDVLDSFIRHTVAQPDACSREVLMQMAETALAENVPWAEARATWLARLDRVADRFIEDETKRQAEATPAAFEAKGEAGIPALGFTLSAKADRIDVDRDGRLHIYDYKTGTPPSTGEQAHFDKQLLLEAAIAERAGFGALSAAPVARALFVGLGSGGKTVNAPLGDEPPDQVWAAFETLIAAYQTRGTGYTARRAMHAKRDTGDYDQLARFGEWDITDDPDTGEVGP